MKDIIDDALKAANLNVWRAAYQDEELSVDRARGIITDKNTGMTVFEFYDGSFHSNREYMKTASIGTLNPAIAMYIELHTIMCVANHYIRAEEEQL